MQKQNNIILVTRPLTPPWDEASKNFAYYLSKNVSGHKFTILTSGKIAGLPENVNQKPIYSSSHFSLYQKMRLIFKGWQMKNDFDIQHYIFTPTKQNSFLIKNFLLSKKSKSIQTVATLREDLFSDSEIKNLIFGNIVVTYSDHAKNKLKKLGFNNVERIYPGIDVEYFYPEEKDGATMQKFGVKDGDFVISYPGEYARLGITDKLVSMITENKDIFYSEKIKFIFACRIKNDIDQKKKLEVIEKLKKEHCLDLVVFSDTFSDMPKLYNLSDIVIFPVATMQGKFDIPLAVIEAMSCAKPTIISNIPVLQEISDGKNSISIEAGNMQKLMDEIIRLMQDRECMREIGITAREYVVKNFNIHNIADKYKNLYDKI